jgi:hypothetical protein
MYIYGCAVSLCGCETWSLTIREELRLRVLTKIFGLKGNEVVGGLRKLHNGELRNLYSSPNIIRIYSIVTCYPTVISAQRLQ